MTSTTILLKYTTFVILRVDRRTGGSLAVDSYAANNVRLSEWAPIVRLIVKKSISPSY